MFVVAVEGVNGANVGARSPKQIQTVLLGIRQCVLVREDRTALPWLVAVALVVAFVVVRSRDHGFPSFDDADGARVQRVVDGDTVRLVGLGNVRLIGVNTH